MALKYSRQRNEVLTFLKGRTDHPTAETVYQNVRLLNPHISLGTVYRNLNLLADHGEILRLRFNDGVEHFDGDTSPHFHFVCTKCGCVIDLNMKSTENIANIANVGFDGRIDGHMTYFYGICPGCLRSDSASQGDLP